MKKITGFDIVDLHGVYTYRVPGERESFDDTVILYGENGSGKTTILRIIFHMLSAANNRHHRGEIRKIPFKSIRITLSDGVVVSAERDESISHSPIEYKVSLPGGRDFAWRHVPDDLREPLLRESMLQRAAVATKPGYLLKTGVVSELESRYQYIFRNSDEKSQKAYLHALKEVAPNLYYISTERQIQSDQIEVTDEQAFNRSRPESRGELIASTRSAYLKQALFLGSKAIQAEALKAASVGGADSNGVYANLVLMLARADLRSNATPPNLNKVLHDLRALRIRNRGFSTLGLTPNFNMEGIFPILRNPETQNQNIIEIVIKPYIDSVNKQLDALEPIYQVVRIFLRSLNGFLSNKTVTFRMGRGFQIIGASGKLLTPEQLSSGEQQLLLIFCNVLASRSGPTLFIIDEPEISLNVKWQRTLVDALRNIIVGSDAQLLIATHSIELLTQHSDKVVVLAPQEIKNKEYVHDDSQEND